MLLIVLGCATAICAAGWLSSRIDTMTLLWYLQEKNVPFPSNEDLKRGSKFVVEHMLRDLLGGERK